MSVTLHNRAPTTPRYVGPVLVDPASDGRKLVTDYADPWGRGAVPAADAPKPTRNVPAWCFWTGAAMGWALGLMCGLGLKAVGL